MARIRAFQHTAARRRLPHSRLHIREIPCFNTQPPEGGWCSAGTAGCRLPVSTHSHPKAAATSPSRQCSRMPFQHTATRRRLLRYALRPAARHRFNTQPPEGGWLTSSPYPLVREFVSTHSHPKAAGFNQIIFNFAYTSFNTQPPKGGWVHPQLKFEAVGRFQHTAA